MTDFGTFIFFYSFVTVYFNKTGLAHSVVTALASECLRNFPLHPIYVRTLPENILTGESYTAFLY